MVAEGTRMTQDFAFLKKNYIDSYPISCKLLGVLSGVDGDLLERQYRNHLSGYLHWDQLVHAESWLLFEKNIGACICIDEVALSRGELYTVLTNKEAHGGKGSMIAIIKGTDVHTVTSVLLKLSVAAVTKCARLLWIWLLTWSRLHASAFLRPNVLPIAFTYRNWLMKLFRRCV